MQTEAFNLVFSQDMDPAKIKTLIDGFIKKKLNEGYINLVEQTKVKEPSKFLEGFPIVTTLVFQRESKKPIVLKEETIESKDTLSPYFQDNTLNWIIREKIEDITRFQRGNYEIECIKYDIIYQNNDKATIQMYFKSKDD